MTRDLPFLDASACAEMIRKRQVSPVEVMTSLLSRIEAFNPRLNAIVTLNERALDDAHAAERTVGRPATSLGPIHGVPFTVKDSFDVAGHRATRGSRLFADHVATKDATAVARLKRAGGIFLGKTNVPEFTLWWETDNLVFGRTVNPWNVDRTPGGSSGGEAAALVAGLSYLGLGSDVAGSIRMPAHFCGVVGLKPTHGRVPLTGHWPSFALRAAHVGPLARSVRDAALALAILSGPDEYDPGAPPVPAPEPTVSPAGASGLRIGLLEASDATTHPEVCTAVGGAAAALADLGGRIENVTIGALRDNDWQTLSMSLIGAEGQAYFAPIVRGREDALTPSLRERFATARYELADYMVALLEAQRLRHEVQACLRQVDVLLGPCVPVPAFAHGALELDLGGTWVPTRHVLAATVPWNFAGNPALAVPFRTTSDGLPIGVQLIGRPFDEARLLQVGAALEAAAGFARRHPMP